MATGWVTQQSNRKFRGMPLRLIQQPPFLLLPRSPILFANFIRILLSRVYVHLPGVPCPPPFQLLSK